MNLVVAVTGASGALAAKMIVARSPWPVALVASRWGREVYERECGEFERLAAQAAEVYADDDLSAPISSGSVATAGMVVAPCSCDTLARIASGIGNTLIARAAHCHLKERRKLVLCVRESPWSLMDLDNARTVSAAGGIVMPISPPFYMLAGKSPETVTLTELMAAYIDRVLAVLGHPAGSTWENVS